MRETSGVTESHVRISNFSQVYHWVDVKFHRLEARNYFRTNRVKLAHFPRHAAFANKQTNKLAVNDERNARMSWLTVVGVHRFCFEMFLTEKEKKQNSSRLLDVSHVTFCFTFLNKLLMLSFHLMMRRRRSCLFVWAFFFKNRFLSTTNHSFCCFLLRFWTTIVTFFLPGDPQRVWWIDMMVSHCCFQTCIGLPWKK